MLDMAPRLYKSLFSTPEPKPLTPMPDPEGPEAQAAKKKMLLAAQSRSGSMSTMLSGDYSGTTLGTK